MREPFCELERACSRLKGRGRATTCALMLRDASQRGSAVEASALLSRCDAPQHEGRRALRILAKRTQRSFPPNEPNDHHVGQTKCVFGESKRQPPAVRNDRRLRSVVSDCYLQ